LKGDPALADIPVVIVTITDEQRRGIALGAAGYLTKPIDRECLIEIVSQLRVAGAPGRVLVVEMTRISASCCGRSSEHEAGRFARQRMAGSRSTRSRPSCPT
jgi:DNA-binding NarL/FixJ family response regulator